MSPSSLLARAILPVLVLLWPTPLTAAPLAGHDELVALFKAWRDFQKPRRVEGAPDYSVRAMAAQHRELATFQARLKALDPGGWTVPQQVDWQIVRAEMNGLDFDHRVLRPWANNTGKIQLEKLLSERRGQLGDAFTFKRYMDELNAAGLIPASLLRWELTGRMPEDVRRMLAAPP